MHVVVCVAPPPPDIKIVGAVVQQGNVVTVKLVNILVVTFAVIFIAPPPFRPITGTLVYPAPPFLHVTVVIAPPAWVHVAVAAVVAPPP